MIRARDVVRVADHDPVPRVVNRGSVVGPGLVEWVDPPEVAKAAESTSTKPGILEAGPVIDGERPRVDSTQLQTTGQTLLERGLEGVVIRYSGRLDITDGTKNVARVSKVVREVRILVYRVRDAVGIGRTPRLVNPRIQFPGDDELAP